MKPLALIFLILLTEVNLLTSAVIGIDSKEIENDSDEPLLSETNEEDTLILDLDSENNEDFEYETLLETSEDVNDSNTKEINSGAHDKSEPDNNFGQNVPYCVPYPYSLTPEERMVGGGFGWAAGTALLIFAFSNTVIIGATMTISYILYQVVIAALAIMAPGVATVFTKFLALFTFF